MRNTGILITKCFREDRYGLGNTGIMNKLVICSLDKQKQEEFLWIKKLNWNR